jgi:hypothetical protein
MPLGHFCILRRKENERELKEMRLDRYECRQCIDSRKKMKLEENAEKKHEERKERKEREKGKRNEQMLNLAPLLSEQHFNE